MVETTFRSLLFARDLGEASTEPPVFTDLNLDAIVEAACAGRTDYALAPLFWTPLDSVEEIRYRHEVFTDLEDPVVTAALTTWGQTMASVRASMHQALALRHTLQRQAWWLHAAHAYVEGLTSLLLDLATASPHSPALRDLAAYAEAACAGEQFAALQAQTHAAETALSSVQYCLLVKPTSVAVRRYSNDDDLGAEISASFERFRGGDTQSYLTQFSNRVDMNHVEEQILDRVAQLFPEAFAALATFAGDQADFVDPVLTRVDREVQFYLAYRELMAPIVATGLSCCLPDVSDESKRLAATGTYDLALALKRTSEHAPVVCNDVTLGDHERIIVVSGPNQGGKTTFARSFGQLHYLAKLGVPVPGASARLFLCDAVFTHFEREESHQDLSGKLRDDLLRIHDILERATARSVVVMNEIFTSTTAADATTLATRVLTSIAERDLLCVCVTFIDELVAVSDTTVSMMSTVDPDDPSERTFRIERRPPDGLAYAQALAEKYGVTYPALKARVAS